MAGYSKLILTHRTGDHDSRVEMALTWTPEGGVWRIERYSGRLFFWVFSRLEGTFKKEWANGKVNIQLNETEKEKHKSGKGVTATYSVDHWKFTRVVVRDAPASHLLQKKGKARLFQPANAAAKDVLVDWEASRAT